MTISKLVTLYQWIQSKEGEYPKLEGEAISAETLSAALIQLSKNEILFDKPKDYAGFERFIKALKQTELYIEESRPLFESVPKPEGLIPLFRSNFSTPERIAAFIIVLLKQGVSDEIIINSGVLHDYYVYYYSDMSTPISITTLYSILSAYPIANTLVEKAKTVSVMISGQYRLCRSNSLDDSNSSLEEERLLFVDRSEVALNAIPASDSFKAFYNVFGQSFLTYIIDNYLHDHNESAKTILMKQLNSREIISHHQLKNLITLFVRNKQGQYLAVVVELLDDASMPLPEYMFVWKGLSLSYKSQEANKRLIVLLFSKILDGLLKETDSNDDYLLLALKSAMHLPSCKTVVLQRAVGLSSQLNQAIQEGISTFDGLSPAILTSITDLLYRLRAQSLKLIKLTPELIIDLPRNQFPLSILVLNSLIQKYGDRIDLNKTMNILFPMDELIKVKKDWPKQKLSDSELALAKSLYPSILDQAVNTNSTSKDWIELSFIVLSAVMKENELFQNSVNNPKHSLDNYIEAKQWSLVKKIIHSQGTNKPDINSVCNALIAATNDNQLEYLLTPGTSSLQELGIFKVQQRLTIQLPADPASLMESLTSKGAQVTIEQIRNLSPDLLKSVETPEKSISPTSII